MINVLYISPSVPVSKSPHAGGQAAHYYINKLNLNPNINLKVICYVIGNEADLLPSLQNENLDSKYYIIQKKSLFSKIKNKFNYTTYGFIANDAVSGVVDKARDFLNEGFVPDVVLFDWEQTSFMLPVLKTIFRDAKYIVIEQDVKSQSLYRFYKNSRNPALFFYNLFLYKRLLAAERHYFSQLDEIVVFNKKDKVLVEKLEAGNENIRIISPYYYDYSDIPILKQKENFVVFFGFLKRLENKEAVEWFVKEVMPHIFNLKFIVIGGGVSMQLKQLASDRVIFTDFIEIEKVKKIFSKALCMVVPLKHGAGIKIKVLEGMSAGLPVLTNDIGIEGINAIHGESYLHCNTPSDYVSSIRKLVDDKQLGMEIGNAARAHLKKYFDYQHDNYI